MWNEDFLKLFSEKNLHSYVLYWKMRFLKSIILFYIEKWGFIKTLFWKRFHPLCIILKNDVFEVNSFVLYWKMRNEDFLKLFPKKICILMYYIEIWCFRSQFFCFVLKNEEWGFLRTLSEKNLHSYVLYWKMRFLKSILLFYIEKWVFIKTLFWKRFHPLCIILKNDVFEVNSFVLNWKMRNEDFLKLFPKNFCILMYYIEKWGFWSQFFCFILKNEDF